MISLVLILISASSAIASAIVVIFPEGILSSTLETVLAIAKKGMLFAKKAATATSLAAFKTLVEKEPFAKADFASIKLGKRVSSGAKKESVPISAKSSCFTPEGILSGKPSA